MKHFTFNDFLYQGEEIAVLQKLIREQRMVHALLISGEPGTGKRSLATLLAASMICELKNGEPCGICRSCRQFYSEEHPDVLIIEKGKPIAQNTARNRASIPVDDIREMIRICYQFSYKGGNRVVMIPNAEDMTVQAQNSLLKILEEPPQNTFFFLTSSYPDQLLTTIRSRCRVVKMIPWEDEYIINRLTDAGIEPQKATKAASFALGSIGKAEQMVSDDDFWHLREQVIKAFFHTDQRSDILKISSEWKDKKNAAETIFDILENEIHAMMKYRLEELRIAFPDDVSTGWQRFAASASVDRFLMMTDSIAKARKQNMFNVNFQAIIEQLLFIFIGESELWNK